MITRSTLLLAALLLVPACTGASTESDESHKAAEAAIATKANANVEAARQEASERPPQPPN
jgi:predicted outer membrane protein